MSQDIHRGGVLTAFVAGGKQAVKRAGVLVANEAQEAQALKRAGVLIAYHENETPLDNPNVDIEADWGGETDLNAELEAGLDLAISWSGSSNLTARLSSNQADIAINWSAASSLSVELDVGADLEINWSGASNLDVRLISGLHIVWGGETDMKATLSIASSTPTSWSTSNVSADQPSRQKSWDTEWPLTVGAGLGRGHKSW